MSCRRFSLALTRAGSAPVYLIPDGAGGWFETSPQVHDRYFAAAQLASGNKLRKVSQLIKAWKHARAVSLPIRSFYTDMVLASSGVCVGAKTYGQCLHDFFAVVSRGACGYLQDPCGIAGKIAASALEVQGLKRTRRCMRRTAPLADCKFFAQLMCFLAPPTRG